MNDGRSVTVVLDTNHFRELSENSDAGRKLLRCIDEHRAEVFTCIVVIEETVRGWFAVLNKRPPGRDQLAPYARLKRDLESLTEFVILPFDETAADHFHRLRVEFPRTGTMDLKIAAICLTHDATLLTRNLSDFQGIPGLRVENWLD